MENYLLHTKHMYKFQDLSLTLFTGLIYKSKALYQVLLSSVQNNKASSAVHEMETQEIKLHVLSSG